MALPTQYAPPQSQSIVYCPIWPGSLDSDPPQLWSTSAIQLWNTAGGPAQSVPGQKPNQKSSTASSQQPTQVQSPTCGSNKLWDTAYGSCQITEHRLGPVQPGRPAHIPPECEVQQAAPSSWGIQPEAPPDLKQLWSPSLQPCPTAESIWWYHPARKHSLLPLLTTGDCRALPVVSPDCGAQPAATFNQGVHIVALLEQRAQPAGPLNYGVQLHELRA